MENGHVFLKAEGSCDALKPEQSSQESQTVASVLCVSCSEHPFPMSGLIREMAQFCSGAMTRICKLVDAASQELHL